MILILGIGNTVRGDDGLGAAAVAALKASHLPNWAVSYRAVHQLTPELAAEIAECDAVIFIDAGVDLAPAEIRRIEISKSDDASAFTHFGTPNGLLATTERLYNKRVRGILFTVGAATLELGESLSPLVQAALPALVTSVQETLEALMREQMV
ncbi:MAG: hydrogenase maturation protease [Anaerolineae bacterium]